MNGRLLEATGWHRLRRGKNHVAVIMETSTAKEAVMSALALPPPLPSWELAVHSSQDEVLLSVLLADMLIHIIVVKVYENPSKNACSALF
jgi:hypothetical protein